MRYSKGMFRMASSTVKTSECNYLYANSADDLLKTLACIDISVPDRTKPRTEAIERYSVCRLLSTLARTEYLLYPLSLKRRERPDFLLTCNGQEIGIELTQATSEDYSAFRTHVERSQQRYKGHWHFIEPTHFRHGKPLNKKQQDDLLDSEKLKGRPWSGDEAEKEWSLYIRDALKNKQSKFQKNNFAKFDQNWLAIHHNSPASFLNK